MRRTLGPVLLVVALCLLAATLSARVLEYRDYIVTITSEKGVRHFAAPGLIVPLWMEHQSWTGPVVPGKPQEFARIDIRKGLYAKAEVSPLQATLAGVVFPLLLIAIALYWAVVLLRSRRSETPAAK